MSMCVKGTPLEHHPDLGLWVKREDLCCPGGPNFSKTRGVYAHIAARPEGVIGVLDTAHSQGGWAVARACALLGKRCHLFYPVRKAESGDRLKPQQQAALDLHANMVPLQAGRSAVLYHSAKKLLAAAHGSTAYMMPNALKLPEMITETAAEVQRTFAALTRQQRQTLPPVVLVSASSGTIAAGVRYGLETCGWGVEEFIVHQGYSRSASAILAYMSRMIGWNEGTAALAFTLVDEGYQYKDEARPGPVPPFPCNSHYDLKAFRWWMHVGRHRYKEALLWNIG